MEKNGLYEKAYQAFSQYLRVSAEHRTESGLPYLPGRQKYDLFTKGRIQAEMKSFEDARKTVEELKSLIGKGINKKELRLCEYILGQIELEKRNYRQAVDLFGRACGRLDFEGEWSPEQAPYFGNLARALYESGDLNKARKTYEKITLLTTGRGNDGDVYAKAFYMLGKIAEQQGDKAGPARTTANSSTSGRTPTPACPRSRTQRQAWPASSVSARPDEKDADVADVRPGRPGEDEVPGLREEGIGIVLGQGRVEVEPELARALEGRAVRPGPGRVGRPVDAVRPQAHDEPVERPAPGLASALLRDGARPAEDAAQALAPHLGQGRQDEFHVPAARPAALTETVISPPANRHTGLGAALAEQARPATKAT